jgi:putative transcriptional regulator
MKRKAWLVHPATPELIFDSQPETLWRRILREKGGMFRVLADSPEDPEAN